MDLTYNGVKLTVKERTIEQHPEIDADGHTVIVTTVRVVAQMPESEGG